MRFGKRFAEVAQSGRPNEPYVSYKELKHTVSKVASIIGGGGGGGASSDDEDCAPAVYPACSGGGASASSSSWRQPGGGSSASQPAALAGLPAASQTRLAELQLKFFRRIDVDIAQVKAYVQTKVAMLEAALGEWQSSAVLAGLLLTPEQLEDVASNLPFQPQNRQDLLDWLFDLEGEARPNAPPRAALLEKYSRIAGSLNGVLRYIEVNLTAVRKIFKKFEKKVPAAMRVPEVSSFTAHHDLWMLSTQHLLVAAVHMQRIVFDHVLPCCTPEAAESVVPVAQLGQESLALLAWLRGPASQLDSLRPAAPGASIDVYAKPGADPGGGSGSAGKAAAAPGEGGAAGAAGDAPAQAAPARRDSGHVAPEVPQVPAHTQSCGRAAAGDAHAPRGQDDEEGEGGRSERRRGGRGRGGGRRGGGPQRGQPGQGSAGGGRHPTASGDAGGAAAAGGCAASGCAGGAGCFDPRMAGATGPGHVFTQVPMYVGKGSCAGMAGSPQQQHALWAAVGASAAAGRGAMLGQPCGGKGSQAGAMDPQQWAAMMPMYWGGMAGMVAYDPSYQ